MVKVINMSKKHTQEYIDNYINEQGWKNLSTYKNGDEKLNLICQNNHSRYISWNRFQQGRRCAICSKKERYTHDVVNEFITNKGWINNSIFRDVKTKLNLICPNGHEQQKTFDKFRQGQRCKNCFYKDNIGKNHHNYKKDRSRKDRTKYLSFSLYNINILYDEPLYENYIQSQNNAKLSNKNWDRTRYTVDHIFPRIAFVDNNLDKIYDVKLIKKICNSRDNLRIVSMEENSLKFSKYNQEEFIKWFNIKIMKENNFVFL